MEWSLDDIASSLRLEFEEGYNDRYSKCKETVERNNRPIELTVGDKHVSPQDLGWY